MCETFAASFIIILRDVLILVMLSMLLFVFSEFFPVRVVGVIATEISSYD